MPTCRLGFIALLLSATSAAQALEIGDPVEGAPAATSRQDPRHEGLYYSLPVMPEKLTGQMPQLPEVPRTQNPPPPPEGILRAAPTPDLPAGQVPHRGPLTEADLHAIYDELVMDQPPQEGAQPRTVTLPSVRQPTAAESAVQQLNDDIRDEERIFLPTTMPKTRLPQQEAQAPDPMAEAKTQTEMAINYLTGKGGVPANPDMALSLLRQAAGRDYAEAQFWLGEAYSGGLGVEANPTRAFSWYAQAAQLGHPLAQMKLSTLYMLGKGTRFDIQKAYEWLEIARLNGNEDAAFVKQSLQGRLSAQEQQDAERAARIFKPRTPRARMAPPPALEPPPSQ
jgi:hypothetical protein